MDDSRKLRKEYQSSSYLRYLWDKAVSYILLHVQETFFFFNIGCLYLFIKALSGAEDNLPLKWRNYLKAFSKGNKDMTSEDVVWDKLIPSNSTVYPYLYNEILMHRLVCSSFHLEI